VEVRVKEREVPLWETNSGNRGQIALTAGIVRNLTGSGASGAGALGNLRQRPQRSVDRRRVRE